MSITISSEEPAALGDIELGGDDSSSRLPPGAVVSPDAKEMYVDVLQTSPQERAALNLPGCCSGSTTWWLWFSSCCLLSVILPLAVLLPVLGSKSDGAWVIWLLLALGVSWVLFSARATLRHGVLCLPSPPPLATAFVNATDAGSEKKGPRKVYVIVNPHGGVKKGKAALDAIVLPIWKNEFGMEVTVLETEYAGHARDYARTVSLEGYDGICVIGGDGSYHEVANGLLQRQGSAAAGSDEEVPAPKLVPIGILPGGSGNSVMLDLGCWSLAEAARRIGRGDVVKIDAVKLTTAGKVGGGGGGALSVFAIKEQLRSDSTADYLVLLFAGWSQADM